MTRPEPPKSVDRDSILFDDLPPHDWAVLRRAIPRRQANEYRAAMRAAGTAGLAYSAWTQEQDDAIQEIWAKRIAQFVTDWSFQDENGKPLLIEPDSSYLIPDQAYERLVTEIQQLSNVTSSEDAKSKSDGDLGVGTGAGDAPAEPAANPSENHASPALVA